MNVAEKKIFCCFIALLSEYLPLVPFVFYGDNVVLTFFHAGNTNARLLLPVVELVGASVYEAGSCIQVLDWLHQLVALQPLGRVALQVS